MKTNIMILPCINHAIEMASVLSDLAEERLGEQIPAEQVMAMAEGIQLMLNEARKPLRDKPTTPDVPRPAGALEDGNE